MHHCVLDAALSQFFIGTHKHTSQAMFVSEVVQEARLVCRPTDDRFCPWHVLNLMQATQSLLRRVLYAQMSQASFAPCVPQGE